MTGFYIARIVFRDGVERYVRRGKTTTDAHAQGQDAQALLHHTSARMTGRYLKHGEVRNVEPLRRKL